MELSFFQHPILRLRSERAFDFFSPTHSACFSLVTRWVPTTFSLGPVHGPRDMRAEQLPYRPLFFIGYGPPGRSSRTTAEFLAFYPEDRLDREKTRRILPRIKGRSISTRKAFGGGFHAYQYTVGGTALPIRGQERFGAVRARFEDQQFVHLDRRRFVQRHTLLPRKLARHARSDRFAGFRPVRRPRD